MDYTICGQHDGTHITHKTQVTYISILNILFYHFSRYMIRIFSINTPQQKKFYIRMSFTNNFGGFYILHITFVI